MRVGDYLDLTIKFHDYSSFFTANGYCRVILLIKWYIGLHDQLRSTNDSISLLQINVTTNDTCAVNSFMALF